MLNMKQRPLIFRMDKDTMPEFPCSTLGNPTSTQANLCANYGAPIGLGALADPSHAEPILAGPSTLASATANEKQLGQSKKNRIFIGLMAGMVALVTSGILLSKKTVASESSRNRG